MCSPLMILESIDCGGDRNGRDSCDANDVALSTERCEEEKSPRPIGSLWGRKLSDRVPTTHGAVPLLSVGH